MFVCQLCRWVVFSILNIHITYEMSVQTDKYGMMWFNKREKFFKKLFPTARFEVSVSPKELDRVISTDERIILIIDNCCDSIEEKYGLKIPDNQIAIAIYRKDKPAITLYDCIKAVENVGWETRCGAHYFFEEVDKIDGTLNLFRVVWGS